MPSVYDKDAFSRRVNYAAQCFKRGTSGTRHFDTCFEMDDGDAVVTALVRRADKDPALHAAIAKRWGGTFPQSWLDTAAQYAGVRNLTALARQQREEADRARSERDTAWETQRQAAADPNMVEPLRFNP